MRIWIYLALVVGGWEWPLRGAPALEGTETHRVVRLDVPLVNRTGFVRQAPDQTGIHFTNRVPADKLAENQILEVGSGVAMGDVDGDGRSDVYLCASEGGNRLFLNRGRWRFEDTTDAAGVKCGDRPSTGAVLADVDGDRDLDLLVNALGGGTRLFANDGDAHFVESRECGLGRNHGSTSLAFGDVNGDGTLDLYVANYSTRTVKDDPAGLDDVRAGYVNGEFVITPPGRFLPLFSKSGGVSLFERAEPDFLYLNDGAGRFTPISWTGGAFLDENGRALEEEPKDWALAVAFRDLNRDGAPDLYVCNDFFHSPDRVWLNDGQGRFRALPRQALRTTSMSSMAVDFADINRDGWDDFLVVDMLSLRHERRQRQRASLVHVETKVPIEDPQSRLEAPRNTLALNRGDGTFSEIAQYAGLEASEWSWSVVFLDVDLDGYEDVLVTTGNVRDANDADVASQNARVLSSTPGATRRRTPLPRLESPCLAFRNQGDLTFRECGEEWGWATRGVSHGMALADLDEDGDLDVVVNHVDQPAGIYRNDSASPRLAVRLHGRSPNTQGIGARIVVRGAGVPIQSQEVISGGRYLSGDDPVRVFAAGSTTNRLRLEVTWRSGATQVVENLPANCRVDVHEAGPLKSSAAAVSTPPPIPGQAAPSLFEDVSDRMRYEHTEEAFDDFSTQPLLTRRLSGLGPGLSWYDADGDGWVDFLLGAGRGGQLILYQNDGHGAFRALRRPARVERDQSGVLGWRGADGGVRLLVGQANFEDGNSNAPAVIQHVLQGGDASSDLAGTSSSTGPLALGVLDGRLALFVGGRVRAGQYPAAASSQLFLNAGDRWQLDEARSGQLRDLGLVSGAVWCDLDGDGSPELILACEWSPIRVFANRDGRFLERTSELGFDRYSGWWNAVTTGDFDGNGRMDVVAANWGRNSKYQRHLGAPLRMYHGDIDGDGRVELLEAYRDPVLARYVPFQPLDVIRRALPALAVRFTNYATYAQADIEQVLGDYSSAMKRLEVTCLDSMLFLNRTERFEAKPLPPEAQFAPAFGLSVNDFDGDGDEDLFVAQNFFGVDAETSRYDAGRGLLLLGDGTGGFESAPGSEGGIVLYGEQRGAAAADFDNDGRTDLAVAQRGGHVGLFRNRGAKPGLRVRLAGPSGNPDGIGAVIRLQYDRREGPARAIHAGSGYWSQESPVQILGTDGPPSALWVRWPGGATSTLRVAADAKEVVVRKDP